MKKTLPDRVSIDSVANSSGASDPLNTRIFEHTDLNGDRNQRELFLRLHAYLVEDKNFTRMKINASELVTALSTNRTYLFEAVKAVTGRTLQQYINHLRQEEARQLLETTDELIEAIAAICGYNSVRTFYRLFRHTYHMSPAVYRKTVRK
ncbi:MAG: helix-turn-helix transcriptional regulator [Bacteroides sp.]|nr:helix-turn-helix transcriptional regulator [Bacteroides sp.]